MDALPRARLVAEAEVASDDQAVARILDPAFDPARTAILAEAPPIALPGGPASGEVTWTERGPNRMTLQNLLRKRIQPAKSLKNFRSLNQT